jgi:hypothetical protein
MRGESEGLGATGASVTNLSFAQQDLLEQLGPGNVRNITDRLRRFAFLSPKWIERLAHDALREEWGQNNYALFKYLAVHACWSIEQGRYTHGENQFYVTAGHLQTRYGTPLYLVFEPNEAGGPQPWGLAYAGSQVSMPEPPQPPEIPAPPAVGPGLEVVMSHDHILGDRADRVSFLAQTPPVAQICAVAGAIQWSINRGLQLPYWYFGRMNYVVPLYLTSRENITMAPDLVAPVEIFTDRLLVRTVLSPHMPYAYARVAVKRHDQLPPWLLHGWNAEAQRMDELQIEDPEADAPVAQDHAPTEAFAQQPHPG